MTNSEPPRKTGSSNSDRADFEAVMQDYSLKFRVVDADPVADPDTVNAALETLRWFNQRLVELESPVDFLLACDLTRRRDWALHALINHGGKGFAKQKQLEVTHGRPLALCTGGGPPVFAKTRLGEMAVHTRGCLRVFAEKTNVTGKKWPRLCPDCQPANGHRQPYRDAKRDIARRVARHLDSVDL